MKLNLAICSGILLLSGLFEVLSAATYLVGPSRTYKQLQNVTGLLSPGDTVIVDGNSIYQAGVCISKSGTPDRWITIRGVKEGGATYPSITGSSMYGIEITGNYIVVEGFEVISMSKGIGTFGNNIIIRSCIIHGCNHGLIGYGNGTGNITVEYCEFFGNGVSTGGATQHQIYMATDEYKYPGAVFRLQYCYLHDGVEGDNVKSRAERNEIYYNWIENAGTVGHGLGLFAPDPDDNENVSTNLKREDADVVGNVIIQTRNSCARIGGDTPGYPTNGRYRFVNNTFILTGSRGDVIRIFNTIETLEMYNNVVYYIVSGGDIRVINDADGTWLHTQRLLIGSNNWIRTGATRLPASQEWSNTLTGSVLPFVDINKHDFRPAEGSALKNSGVMITPTVTDYPFANPLFPPVYHSPVAVRIEKGTQQPRIISDVIDIGAFEAVSSKVRFTKNTVNHNKFLQTNISDDYFSIYNLLGNRLRTFTAANASSVNIIDGVIPKQTGIRAFVK